MPVFSFVIIPDFVIYFVVAMAKSKSSTSSLKKTSRSKGAAAVRDIKKKDNSDTFMIHQIKDDDKPTVEPLMEDDFMEEDNDFEADDLDVDMDIDYEPVRPPTMKVAELSDESDVKRAMHSIDEALAKDVIKVKFGSFVQLVANRDMEDAVAANFDQDIILSSNLLTELASARDQREEKKIPLVFLVGIAIGVVLTYIFFST